MLEAPTHLPHFFMVRHVFSRVWVYLCAHGCCLGLYANEPYLRNFFEAQAVLAYLFRDPAEARKNYDLNWLCCVNGCLWCFVTIMHAYRTDLIMQELNLEGSGITLLK